MSYTPQQFLDDVKTYMVRRMDLTEGEKAKLLANNTVYKPWPTQPIGISMIRTGGILMGGTEADKSATYLFGGFMHHSRDLLAMSLAHELGHVLTDDVYQSREHGPKWSMNVLRLGVFEPPYIFPSESRILLPGETPFNNTKYDDLGLEAYVKSLPQIDWSETDATPKP